MALRSHLSSVVLAAIIAAVLTAFVSTAPQPAGAVVNCYNVSLSNCSDYAECTLPYGTDDCPWTCRFKTCHEYITEGQCNDAIDAGFDCAWLNSYCMDAATECSRLPTLDACEAHTNCVPYYYEESVTASNEFRCISKNSYCSPHLTQNDCDSYNDVAECDWLGMDPGLGAPCIANTTTRETCQDQYQDCYGDGCEQDPYTKHCLPENATIHRACEDTATDLACIYLPEYQCMSEMGYSINTTYAHLNPGCSADCKDTNDNADFDEVEVGFYAYYDVFTMFGTLANGTWEVAEDYASDFEFSDNLHSMAVSSPEGLYTYEHGAVQNAYMQFFINTTTTQKKFRDTRGYSVRIVYVHKRTEPGFSTTFLELMHGDGMTLSFSIDFNENLIVNAFDPINYRSYTHAARHPCVRVSDSAFNSERAAAASLNSIVVNVDPTTSMVSVINEYYGSNCMSFFLPGLEPSDNIVVNYGGSESTGQYEGLFMVLEFANRLTYPHSYPSQGETFCKTPILLPFNETFPEEFSTTTPPTPPTTFSEPPTFFLNTTLPPFTTTPCQQFSAVKDSSTSIVIPVVAAACCFLLGIAVATLRTRKRARVTVPSDARPFSNIAMTDVGGPQISY